MISPSVVVIHSRDNAFVKDLRRLAQDTTAYRKQGRVWLEGDHLCRAALARGQTVSIAVFSESFWPLAPVEWAQAAPKSIVLADALFADISGLESPAQMGFIIDVPVGTAFGFRQVVALKGSAALWSPKVLRAGMGAHFALDLIEAASLDDLRSLRVPMLVTHVHEGDFLHRTPLPWPCAWVLGHEGQGVCATLEEQAALRIRIAQPGGEESLNVAAAAAICLHASGAAR